METLALVLPALIAGLVIGGVAVWWTDQTRYAVEFRERLQKSNEKAAEVAVAKSRATIKGQIGERFAPFEAGFGYEPADARFLGSPVDYVVFDGLAEGEIRGIAFVEVKVGALQLTQLQRQIWKAVDDGRVYKRIVQLPDPTSDV